MNKRILTILFLFVIKTSFSQNLKVEAVYYDTQETPYKIERKYLDKNILTYVIHDNENSYCVKRQTSISGDTMIIKESSYQIFNKKTKIDEIQECESWMVSSNIPGDTVWLKGYKIEYSPDTMILLCDTVLTGELAKNSDEFFERIKISRVPLILSGKIKVSLDSLIINETVLAYFINSIPVKVEVFDGKNKKFCISSGKFYKNKLVWKRYFIDKGKSPYQIDTISWNHDTTELLWHSKRYDRIKWNTISKYHINGTKLKITFSDNLKREIKYLEGESIFRNLLIGGFIYDDVLYYLELRLFDRERIISVESNGQSLNNRYTLDNLGRVAEQLSSNNGKVQKRVTYKYGD